MIIIFSASFIGINIATNKASSSNDHFSTSRLFTLGNQAIAYCNEKPQGSEIKDGRCSGEFNYESSRCFRPIDPNKSDCVLDLN